MLHSNWISPMTSLLSRLSLWPAIGLVIEDQEISLSVVATTPAGRREVVRDVQSSQGKAREDVLTKMLAPWLPPALDPKKRRTLGMRRSRRPWLQIAIPESRVFQAVVPITGANRSAPPQAFFMEAVQSTNLRSEERIIDLIKLEIDKQPLACLAASPRQVITELIDLLHGLGARVAMIEPGPAGLVRAGGFRKKLPRGSKLAIRFFLGRTQAIGVLTTQSQPLIWHTFDLPTADETAAILATYSTLWMQGRHAHITQPIDAVVIHGRSDLELTIKPESFRERTGARLFRCEGPGYESVEAALGTALANPFTEAIGLDLARGLKPEVPIREIFPWSELVLEGVLVVGVSLYLNSGALELQGRLESTRVELSAFSWLKNQDQAKLEKEKKALEERVQVLDAFQATRVDWATPLGIISGAMPDSTLVSSFQGTVEGESGVKASSKAKTQMIVNFTTPLAVEGAMPLEINSFIATVRADPALRKRFSTIEVSGLGANKGHGDLAPYASYSLVCLGAPTTAKVVPKPPPPAAK
jgi:hypothetical protein